MPGISRIIIHPALAAGERLRFSRSCQTEENILGGVAVLHAKHWRTACKGEVDIGLERLSVGTQTVGRQHDAHRPKYELVLGIDTTETAVSHSDRAKPRTTTRQEPTKKRMWESANFWK